MNRIWNRWLIVLLAALVLGTGAHAQNCDFEFEDVCVELPNGLPTPDRELRVDVTVSGPVPGEGLLFYRPTGSGPYNSVEPERVGNRYIVSVPAEAVTVRGLDVYGLYTSADGERFFYPEEDEQESRDNPVHISTYIGSFTSPVELPARDYRMISVAVDVGPGSVLDVLEDDLGTPDVARWRLLRWDPSTQSYGEFPNVTNSFANGAAFWIITSDGGSFDVDLVESTNPDSLPVIALAPEANQIGNPYAFPVAWDDVLTASELEAADIGRPLAFDGVSPYVPVDVLEPWTGYFVFNETGESLSLTVPDREAGLLRVPRSDAQATYAVRVSAESGAYRDTLNVMGFAPAAQVGRDQLDLAEPPPIGEHVHVSIVDGGSRWMRNFKPESADGAAWDIEVTATGGLLDGEPRRVSLDLQETGVRPSGFDLYVIDQDRGTAVELVDGVLDITLNEDRPVRHFRLIAGTEAFAQSESDGAPLSPTAFALAPGYPNPFAAQTTFRYQLDARGSATLEVFDVLGRRVRVLANGEQTAGAHTATWDGRDAAGRSVANGVYLIRLRSADASATRRVSVLR